jgi:hypothetical protein
MFVSRNPSTGSIPWSQSWRTVTAFPPLVVEFKKAIMENSPDLSIAGEPVFETVECWKCLGAREYEIEYVACAIF